MTVKELIEALKKMPQDDEVKLGLSDADLPLESVFHESSHDQDYVVIA